MRGMFTLVIYLLGAFSVSFIVGQGLRAAFIEDAIVAVEEAVVEDQVEELEQPETSRMDKLLDMVEDFIILGSIFFMFGIAYLSGKILKCISNWVNIFSRGVK